MVAVVIFATDLPLPAIVTGVFSVITAIIGGIIFVMKGIFTYFAKRVDTLETREATILTGLVETVENMQASSKKTADFVVSIVEEQKYEARRRQEDRAEDRKRDDAREAAR